MKKLLLIPILTFVFTGNLMGQLLDQEITMVFRDSIGNTDTVVVGAEYSKYPQMLWMSSCEIDTALGEADITTQPHAVLDARSVSRVYSDSCTNYNSYSSYSYETKKDYRPSWCGPFSIEVHAQHPPVTVTTYGLGDVSAQYLAQVFAVDGHCVINNYKDTLSILPSSTTINEFVYQTSDSSSTSPFPWTIKTNGDSVSLQIEFHSSSVPEEEHVGFAIYPNPTNEAFTIEFDSPTSGVVSILDVYGRVIWNEGINQVSALNPNVGVLPTGVYWVVLRTKDQEPEIERLVVK